MAFDVSCAHTRWQDVVASAAVGVCKNCGFFARRWPDAVFFFSKSHVIRSLLLQGGVLVVEDDIHSSRKSAQGLPLLGYCAIRVCVQTI